MSRAENKGKKKLDLAMDRRRLSDSDVAQFLKSLAALYRDKRSGNLALADALSRTAKKLAAEPRQKPATRIAVQKQLHLRPTLAELRGFDAEAITRFLSDEMNTKVDLLDFAAARFAIPRGRLLRLKLEEIRDVIRASLQHEDSLKIITQEAERNGSTRRS